MRKIPIKTCGFLLKKGLHIWGTLPPSQTQSDKQKRFNAPRPPGIARELILKLEKYWLITKICISLFYPIHIVSERWSLWIRWGWHLDLLFHVSRKKGRSVASFQGNLDTHSRLWNLTNLHTICPAYATYTNKLSPFYIFPAYLFKRPFFLRLHFDSVVKTYRCHFKKTGSRLETGSGFKVHTMKKTMM